MTAKTVREFLIEAAIAQNLSLTDKCFRPIGDDVSISMTFYEVIEIEFPNQLDDVHDDNDSDYFADVLLDCAID